MKEKGFAGIFILILGTLAILCFYFAFTKRAPVQTTDKTGTQSGTETPTAVIGTRAPNHTQSPTPYSTTSPSSPPQFTVSPTNTTVAPSSQTSPSGITQTPIPTEKAKGKGNGGGSGSGIVIGG